MPHASLQWDLGDTRGTVAVRMPDHQVALEILERTGPLAVSSANLTGRPAATEAAEAEEMLGEDVEVVVDAGTSPGGAASTIVDATGHPGPGAAARRHQLAQLNEVLEPLGHAIPDPDAPADGTDEDAGGRDVAAEADGEGVHPRLPGGRARSPTCSRWWPGRSRSGPARSRGSATATCTTSPSPTSAA